MPRKKPHPLTCPRCPHRFSDVGCPFYLTGDEGILEEKPTIGGPPEVRLVKGCIWHEGHLMRWISHMVVAANRPAAVLQGWRNDMVEQFQNFGHKVTFTEIMKSLVPEPKDITSITLGDSDAKKQFPKTQ